MIIFFIFILFLLIENFVISALTGVHTLMLTQVFLVSLVIFNRSRYSIFLYVLILGFIGEMMLGLSIGDIIIPVALVAIIYILINRFIELDYIINENKSVHGLMMATLVLIILAYIYLGFFIFWQSGFSPNNFWSEIQPFFNLGIIFNMAATSFVVSLIWKYVIQKEKSI